MTDELTAELIRALRAVVVCLEHHIKHEAARLHMSPETLCPCMENEVAHARAVLARAEEVGPVAWPTTSH